MKTFKAVALALFGTFIEYYDYALYGFAAPILAQHFFPKSDPTILLLQAYGVFFAGSCSKPLGSLLFGFIGDRFGRSFALKLSIFGITIPTVCIGLLPDYQTLGWLAACLLILCRILQGIFVSGESDSARVFIFESLPKKYRCFSNSLAYCLCMLGIYWASFSLSTIFSGFSGEKVILTIRIGTNSLLELLPNIEIDSWRLPFLLAGAFGLFLFILRQGIQETQPFLHFQKEKNLAMDNEQVYIAQIASAKKMGSKNQNTSQKINTLKENSSKQNNEWQFSNRHLNKWQFKISNKSAIFITLLMTGAAGGQYHFYFVFLPSYLSKVLNPIDCSLTNISATNISAAEQSHLLLIFAICMPLAGFLTDKFSHRFNLITLLKASAIIIINLAILNILFIQQGYLPYSIMVLTAVALSFAQANTFVAILNQFNVGERCRGTSLGHALGSMLFSGSTPLVSLWIWNFFQIPCAPFCYFLILCSISYFALLLLEHQQPEKDFFLTKDREVAAIIGI